MIKNIEISRFKSIKSLSMELGRVNIFVGANGAGKSNILEAIGLASAALNRGFGDLDLVGKGIRLTPTELMKTALKSGNAATTLEICTNFSKEIAYKCNLIATENDSIVRVHSESCSLQGKKQFGRSGNGSTVFAKPISSRLEKSRGMWDQIKTAHEFSEDLIEQFDQFSKYKIFTPQTDILRGARSGFVDEAPIGLHGEGLPVALANIIKNRPKLRTKSNAAEFDLFTEALGLVFLPGWTNKVEVGAINAKLVSRGLQEKNSAMIYFIDKYMNLKRNTLSVYDSSEGTLFLLFIAILLAHKESPRYFALDNVDNALNPLMTRRLLETIIKAVAIVENGALPFGPKQIFLTSHNPTSLDAFDIFDEDQRIFVVYRSPDGATTVNRLQPGSGMTRDEWRIAANGRNLSQLWLEGMIDGINGVGGL